MRTYKKVFRDSDKLEEMFRMREGGKTYTEIGLFFGVDHTAVSYQYNKRFSIPTEKKPVVRVRKIDTTKHCPVCELLWISKFSCEYCAQFKNI